MVLVATHADGASARNIVLDDALSMFAKVLKLVDPVGALVLLDLRQGTSSVGLRGLVETLQTLHATMMTNVQAQVPNCCAGLLLIISFALPHEKLKAGSFQKHVAMSSSQTCSAMMVSSCWRIASFAKVLGARK